MSGCSNSMLLQPDFIWSSLYALRIPLKPLTKESEHKKYMIAHQKKKYYKAVLLRWIE